MNIMRISLLLLLLGVAIVSGCKVAQEVTEDGPGEMLGEGISEQELDSGMQELEDIDSLEQDELDGSLDEIDKMDWE